MGRPHKDVVVVVAFDAGGHKVREDIVPRQSFNVSGSILLNSAPLRQKQKIRMASVRVFDVNGYRLDNQMRYFGPNGEPVQALHRRPDGTIIDTSG